MQVQSVSFRDVPGSTTDLLHNLGYGCLRSVHVNLAMHPGIDTDASGEEFSHQRKGQEKVFRRGCIHQWSKQTGAVNSNCWLINFSFYAFE